MPVYLEPRDATADLEGFASILIVSCPVCPPMSLAMQKKKPFIELFKHGLKTEAFEDHIKSIREPLDQRGVRTGVFTMLAPSPMMCLWTARQRHRLLKRATDYEAVLVLGCDSAVCTVTDALKDTDCRVIQGMNTTAVANATTRFRFPATVTLEMHPLPPKRRHENPLGAAKESEKVAP